MYCHKCGTLAATPVANYCHVCGTELVKEPTVCVCTYYGRQYCDAHKDKQPVAKKPEPEQKQPKASPAPRKSARIGPGKPCTSCGAPTTAETRLWHDGAKKKSTEYRICSECVAQGKGVVFAC